jgi:hypothetical protein
MRGLWFVFVGITRFSRDTNTVITELHDALVSWTAMF